MLNGAWDELRYAKRVNKALSLYVTTEDLDVFELDILFENGFATLFWGTMETTIRMEGQSSIMADISEARFNLGLSLRKRRDV